MASAHLLLLVALLAEALAADSVTEFRDLFAATMKLRDPTRTDDYLHGKVLFPAEGLLATPSMSAVEDVDSAYIKYRPSDLQAEGQRVPFNSADPLGLLQQRRVSGRAPVTIVIISGMQGEFLPRLAFAQAYDNQSSFGRAFSAALAKTPVTAKVWDTLKYTDIELPLEQLVAASSIDLPNGTTLYNILWLRQHEGSLESLAAIDQVTPRLADRIQKVLDIMGNAIDDFVVLGYSRGAVDALDLMSRAESLGWSKRMRGVITHNGVNFGSHLADCARGDVTSNPPELCENMKRALPLLRMLINDLKPSKLAFIKNTEILGKALKEAGDLVSKLPSAPELNGTTILHPDLVRLWNELVKNVVFGLVDIWHPVADYSNNIRRAQKIAQAFLDSAELLSTAGRIEWFKKNTLPTDALYMVTTATMQNRDVNDKVMHPDTYSIRNNYYQNLMAGATELCDGQVSTGRELLLPQLHMKVNSAQKQYAPDWLGILFADHWSVSLDYVIPCPDGYTSPWPRMELLDAYASYIALRS